VLLLGTHTGWSIAVSTLGLGVTCALAVHASRREPAALGPAHGAFLLALGFTALQALPLPAGLVAWLAPGSLADGLETARVLGEEPPWLATLSRSGAATLRELLEAAALAAAFFAGSLAIPLVGRQPVALAGAIGVLAAAFVTIAHVVVGAESVYGVFEHVLPVPLMGPIGNVNHLAGMLAMGVPVLVGLALDADERARRGWLLGAASLSGAFALACISRGGVLSLGVGLGTLLVLVLLGARRARDHRTTQRAWTALVAFGLTGLALGVAAYVLSEEIALDFGTPPLEKLELAARGLVLLADAPWLGVGRGAFGVAFTALDRGGRMFFPENLLVQWSTEWGLPVTLTLLGALGAAWLRAARQATSPTQLGALAATLSIFVHDQVDFALEKLAVSASAAVLLAAALTPSTRSTKETARLGAKPDRRTLALRASPAVLAVALALLCGAAVHRDDPRRLEAEMLALAASDRLDEVERTGRTAMRAHPSEPVFPLILGWAVARADDLEAPRWLDRAGLLAPTWPAPHLILSRWLARRGNLTQAWLEVREAERRSPLAGAEEICLFVPFAEVNELARVFADEPLRSRVLSHAARCAGVPADRADGIDRALLDGSPPPDVAAEADVRRARRALATGELAEAGRLLGSVPELPADAPASWSVRFARADLLVAQGRPDEASELLAPRAPIELEALRLESLARAHARAGNAEGMRAAVRDLRAFAAGSGPRLAVNATLLGHLEASLGNVGRAYQAFEEAARLDPECDARRALAQLAAREGDHARAADAYAELCRAGRPDGADCAEADRARRLEREAP